MEITKVQEINENQNTTTIPKKIATELKLKKGDRVIWLIENGKVVIKKLVV